jgi:hypothetical protein
LHSVAASLDKVGFGLCWIVLSLLCFVVSSASSSSLFALLLVVHPALTNPFFLPSLHFLLVVGCCFPPSCGFLLGPGAPHTTFSIPWPRCSTWIFLGSFLVGAPEFSGPNLGALFFLLVAGCCFPQSWGSFLASSVLHTKGLLVIHPKLQLFLFLFLFLSLSLSLCSCPPPVLGAPHKTCCLYHQVSPCLLYLPPFCLHFFTHSTSTLLTYPAAYYFSPLLCSNL